MKIDGYAGNRRRDAELARLVDHALHAELDAEPDRRNVARLIERAAHRNLAGVVALEVLRRPRAAAAQSHGERRVVEDVRQRAAVLHRVGVDDRLERRSRLTHRLHRAIELAVVEVAAADERADGAGARIHRDERALQIRRVGASRLVVVVRLAPCTSRSSCAGTRRTVPASIARICRSIARSAGDLQVEVERRVDLEALLVELLAELVVELLANPFDEVRRELARFDARRELERIRLRFARLRRRR